MTDTAPSRHIVLVTRNFPPLVGGMEKLNFHLAREIGRRWSVTLIGPKGAEKHPIANVTTATCPSSAAAFLVCAASKALWFSVMIWTQHKKIRPSAIIAGSGVSAPIAWLMSTLCGSPFGVYLHGLDVIASNRIYRKLFLPCIRKADFLMANSTATKARASEAGIDPSRIEVINPGVSSEPGYAPTPNPSAWREAVKLPPGKLLLSVGRLTKRKGLREFINNCLPDIVKKNPDVHLVIVGSEPAHALLRNEVGKTELLKAAELAGVSDRLHFMGRLSDEDLSRLYQVCDVHIFPIISVPGDMEGFGMVAIESAAHGLPTVAFAEGGVIDAVSDGQSGHLVPPGDYTQFSNAVLKTIDNSAEESARQSAKHFASQFEWEIFGKKVRDYLSREASI